MVRDTSTTSAASKSKKKTKKVSTQVAKKVIPKREPQVAMKVIHNTSLQSWPIPIGNGTIKLMPGGTINIPASAVTNRLINLYKRRLISIS
jgi:hypothetical protein